MKDEEIIPAADPEMGLPPAIEPRLAERLPLDSDGRAPVGGFDSDGRPRDLLGRKQPYPFTWLTFFRAVPGLVDQFARRVPSSFYAQDKSGVIVSCPCGEEPLVALVHSTECACGRVYLNLGDSVRVANSPQSVA